MATKKKAVKRKPSNTVTLELTRDEAQRLYNLSVTIFMPPTTMPPTTEPRFRGILDLPKEQELRAESIDNIIASKLAKLGFHFAL